MLSLGGAQRLQRTAKGERSTTKPFLVDRWKEMWCQPHSSTYRQQQNLYLYRDLLNRTGILCPMPNLFSKSPLQCPWPLKPKHYLVKKKRISNWPCIKKHMYLKLKFSGIWIILPLMEKCSRWAAPSELCSQRHLFLKQSNNSSLMRNQRN